MTLPTIQSLDGLALRKAYWEARGWRLFFIGDGSIYHEVIPPQDPPFAMEPDQARLWEEVPFSQISDRDLMNCPAVEQSADISERELMEVCRERGYSFELYGPIQHPGKANMNGQFGCKVARWDGNFYDPFIEVFGPAPSIARTRAALGVLTMKGPNENS